MFEDPRRLWRCQETAKIPRAGAAADISTAGGLFGFDLGRGTRGPAG